MLHQFTLIVIKGLLIGILVSAPMGPVGVLCIRRTLSRGHKAGFFTGLGAALSDLLYGSITLWGAELALDSIQKHEIWIDLVGSCFLLLFGWYLHRYPPQYEVQVKPKKEQNSKPFQTISSSFLITLSNPLIVLFFITLYSWLGLPEETNNILVGHSVTMISIAAGALLWWSILTSSIVRLKKHVSLSSTRYFNQIVAIVFMVLALISIGVTVVKLIM